MILADTFQPSTFVDAFRFIGDHGWLIWHKTVEQLILSGSSMGVAIGIAIPIGIWLGHVHRGSFAAINISNVGRALPSLAVIAIALPFIGVGFWDVLLALVVLAVPLMLTNAYVAVDGVDPDVVEAARGMGMREIDVLVRIELPLALPLVFAGIRTAAVYVVSTATIAAIAGGGGLGDIIVNQASYRLEGVIGAAICVAALAILADFAFAFVQFAVSPRGLRHMSAFEANLPTAIPLPEP
ncbi:MAG TPA: ABC transporter permease subunit [Gaiellaceae bacterium]|nr:ABC transporter permease subunit [Gaiellaceae bacterium]